MGYVYFATADEPCRVMIGATDDLEQKLASLQEVNCTVRLHRTLELQAPFACARYLHGLYGSRRLLSADGYRWFAMEEDEIEHAIGLWRAKASSYREGLRRVKELRLQRASTNLVKPAEADLRCGERLRQINHQISGLQFEKECLEIELKLRIGSNAGLERLAIWESREARRFDSAEFKASHPELYEQFRKPVSNRYFKLM